MERQLLHLCGGAIAPGERSDPIGAAGLTWRLGTNLGLEVKSQSVAAEVDRRNGWRAMTTSRMVWCVRGVLFQGIDTECHDMKKSEVCLAQ